MNETIVFIRKRRADYKAVQKDTAVLPHEQANHTPIFRSTSSVGSAVEDKLFRLSLPLGLHIQYEGDVLHSRSPSLSTREILRDSERCSLSILLHQSWSQPLSSFLVANSVDSEVCLGREGCYWKVDCPLRSRSPPLSTRGIIRESDILVRLAASVLVSISESLPYGRTRQRSAALPFNGNRQGMALARGQRCSHSLPFFTQFAWQLTSTCN
jgi:hypothetical protein